MAGHFLPDALWAALTSILISYHLFLGWLLFTADNKVGFSLPVGHTIVTHLACLALVVGLAISRHYIPFFGLLRYLIPGIAPFERDWLFNAADGKKNVVATAPPVEAPHVEATLEDYDAWLKHLSTRHPSSVKRGMTVKQEYENFIAARAKNRALAESTKQQA